MEATPQEVPASQPALLSFSSHDGATLHYRHWPAANPTRKALVLFHRGHEHSARWQETVEKLALKDVDIFAWDARGHGASPGERGSAEHIGVLIRDADAFARHIVKAHGIAMEDMIAVAHSVGGVVAGAWIHDFAPPIRAFVMATPALKVRLYVPLAIPALRLKQRLFGQSYVKSYVKAQMLTHDPEQAQKYTEDSSIFPQIAVNLLLDLHDTGERLIADAGAIRVPTLLLAAGADWVVDVGAQRKFFERLGSTEKTMRVFPGMYHAIFHEKGREEVVAEIRTFVERQFSRPRQAPAPLRDADKAGYTRTEYLDLQDAPNTLIAKVSRTVMSTVGRMSGGIDLGLRSGFDSGETLDYVYENKPRGHTFAGKFFDKLYLESPGWSGIRMRRKHLEEMLRAAIQELHAAGKPVHILDAACGGGRYVLETLAGLREIPATALIRDYKPQNLKVAEALRDKLNLSGVKIVQGDAFDLASYDQLEPRPTIGIVSGLLELFPDNAPARACLSGFAKAIEPGGILIYTGQPWHPQLKFIAGVLDNREGRPWVMRRRTQEEMDELVREAGFEKEGQAIDPWGIFTVSRARRTA